jgi:hypothetical protein
VQQLNGRHLLAALGNLDAVPDQDLQTKCGNMRRIGSAELNGCTLCFAFSLG